MSTPPKLQDAIWLFSYWNAVVNHIHKDLTRTARESLTNKPEKDLVAITILTVKEQITNFAPAVSLQNVRQYRDETIRSFGQACLWSKTTWLRQVFIQGLQDANTQLELLGDPNQYMILEQVFKFVEAKEDGKRSASHLLDCHSTYNLFARSIAATV